MEYNIDGAGYYVVNTPYGKKYDDVDGDRICFYDEGNETVKLPYLNFFPTVAQMSNYTVGELITSEVSWFQLLYISDFCSCSLLAHILCAHVTA